MYLPLLYTAGTCDVMYIGVYNIYLHGKCFLSALHDIICLMPPQSTQIFLSSDSSSHAYATSRSSSLRTDQHYNSCRNTTCSLFASVANTRDTAVVFLWKASAVNASLPFDWAGMQLDLVCPVKCHWLSHFLLASGKLICEWEFHGKLCASFCRYMICV